VFFVGAVSSWECGPSGAYNPRMRTVCWLLIGLAALAFSVGTAIAFTHSVFLLEPVGYWRGAVGFLLFAIAIRMMETRA
jgi:uncharacterized membrane protein